MDKCDCLERLGRRMRKMYGNDTSLTNVEHSLDLRTGKALATHGPAVIARYRLTKKDGSLSSKWKDVRVYGDFCQFCGKRTMEAEEEKHG